MARILSLILAVAALVAGGPALAQGPHGDAAWVDGGLGRGITVISADGRSALNLRARFQARATESIPLPGTDDWVTEFLIRRARVVLQGHILGESWRYYVQYGFSNLDMEPDLRLPLRDAYLTWRATRDFHLRVGQMKVPFDRQRVVSSSALQMVDRSIVVQELNLDRDVGIQAFSTDLFGMGERLGYQLGLFGGHGRNRLGTAAGVLVVARLQVTPFGAFDDYVEADLDRSPRPRLAVAGGWARNVNTNRERSTFGPVLPTARFDYDHLEADLMFKWRGLSVISEVIYRQSDRLFEERVVGTDTVREYARPGWGWFVQSGYMLSEHFEIAGRYGDLHPLEPDIPTFRRTREVGAAFSWYSRRHDFKLQSDWFTLIQEGAPGAQQQARVQMQLFF